MSCGSYNENTDRTNGDGDSTRQKEIIETSLWPITCKEIDIKCRVWGLQEIFEIELWWITPEIQEMKLIYVY